MEKKDTEKQFERHITENELLIYKVCRIYAYTDADRQDLFQDSTELWRAFPNFKGDAKFSTWLYRVAINTAVTGLRRQKDFITSFEPSTLPVQAGDNDYASREEQFRELYTAIEQLNPVEKAIVMLYLEDRPYEEMEDILGITQGNLRVKMNRIKKKLRELTKIIDNGAG